MSTYLWQNFLKDGQIIKCISDSIQSLFDKSWAKALIEVWPWKWAITKKIFKISDSFFVIEKDETMLPYLQWIWLTDKQIILWDVLEQDIVDILWSVSICENEAIVVWNLPYYITSPIFKHLFWKEEPKLLWGFFMIQDEVWEKIKSDANKKSYLWWLLNRAYVVEYVKTVPAKCFSPAPKVKSCLVRLTKKEQVEMVDFQSLLEFLNLFSPYSRKTLWKISKMIEKKWGKSYNIPEVLLKKRLEELSWEQLEEIIS